ncbi:serine/threonine-protein kinase [Nannocystis radixulma]|uniref:Serine/threonine-protein kinase n=1 Tax=Nannocystis radixulma TaxID=2995305 RepID=A0ABT5BPB1_9BACT|nr:serine/threonine-protein kinase [Nannocystis radixulma]MDC0675942.1 serine/threonine-protein kinase [Nannocystis radixulma]
MSPDDSAGPSPAAEGMHRTAPDPVSRVGDDFESLGVTGGSFPGAPANTRSDLAAQQHQAVLRAQLFGDEPAQPVRIGRFAVLRMLGAGAMGVVYTAYDEQLERKVAIKLLRGGDGGEHRLLREAQALARLAHPNVVGVHEVGVHEGRVFLAMEFVAGQAASAWQRERPRTVRETLDVYLQAGRGLAAAHAVGLVHRDFKPDNVIVGADGRVRVLDFGLAVLSEKTSSSEHGSGDMTLTTAVDASSQTDTAGWKIAGTPAFMAPELFCGERPDARSDQFSFCVALWHALFKRRPFVGDDLAAVIDAVVHGRLTPPPAGSKVPARVVRVVTRGLSREPAQRFATMTDLLAALEPRAGRGRVWLAAAALALGGAGAAVVFAERGPPLCAGAADELAGVWDDERRQTLHAAFLATGVPFAEAAWTRAAREIDEHVDVWKDMYEQSCLATHVRGTQSMALLDLRTACLRRRLDEVRALTDLFAAADVQVVERAARASELLGPLARCADAEALMTATPPPEDPAVRRDVEALRVELDQARALHFAGRFPAGRALADAAVDRARALAYPPVIAEALALAGVLQAAAGDPQRAEITTHEALRAAATSRRSDLVADAWTRLTEIVGEELGRYDEGLAWSRAADAAVLQAGDAPLQRAAQLVAEGKIFHERGEYTEAEARYTRALALREQALAADDPAIADALTLIASARRDLADFPAAFARYERALEIRTRALGPDHPDVAVALANMAMVLDDLGRHTEARESFARARELMRAALPAEHPLVAAMELKLGGAQTHRAELAAARVHLEAAEQVFARSREPDHPDLVRVHQSLGVLAFQEGDYPQTIAHAQRALAAIERRVGADHPDAASALDLLGMSHDRLGEPARAVAHFRRALAIRERRLGPDHPYVAESHGNLASGLYALGQYEESLTHDFHALELLEKSLGPDHRMLVLRRSNLGLALNERGRHDEALAHYERAVINAERAFGPHHDYLVVPLTGVGSALVELGRPLEALVPLERALAIAEHSSLEAVELAFTRYALARALWNSRVDRARARTLASAAVTVIESGGPAYSREVAEIREWIAARR